MLYADALLRCPLSDRRGATMEFWVTRPAGPKAAYLGSGVLLLGLLIALMPSAASASPRGPAAEPRATSFWSNVAPVNGKASSAAYSHIVSPGSSTTAHRSSLGAASPSYYNDNGCYPIQEGSYGNPWLCRGSAYAINSNYYRVFIRVGTWNGNRNSPWGWSKAFYLHNLWP